MTKTMTTTKISTEDDLNDDNDDDDDAPVKKLSESAEGKKQSTTLCDSYDDGHKNASFRNRVAGAEKVTTPTPTSLLGVIIATTTTTMTRVTSMVDDDEVKTLI